MNTILIVITIGFVFLLIGEILDRMDNGGKFGGGMPSI